MNVKQILEVICHPMELFWLKLQHKPVKRREIGINFPITGGYYSCLLIVD